MRLGRLFIPKEFMKTYVRAMARRLRTVLNIPRGIVRHARGLSRMRGIQAAGTTLSSPNDAVAWEKIYQDQPLSRVNTLNHPVARAVAEVSEPGDILLETGCGSGAISAELATCGRIIELCDFSQRILARAARLFEVSGLPTPRTTFCDITAPLPWADRSIDVVWSSGVLEHWTDEQLRPIVREMARISRKRVVSLVPYAGCLLYRLGKELAERDGKWQYGRELPRPTLRHIFEDAQLRGIREYTIWDEVAPAFLDPIDFKLAQRVREWWSSLPGDDPVKCRQGYLLVTIGEVAKHT
jgi:hypothetical protein